MDKLYTLLFEEYEGNTHFMNALHELWRGYRRLLHALALGSAGIAYGVNHIGRPAFAWSALARLAYGSSKFTKSGVLRKTRFVNVIRYQSALESLSNEWGLRSVQAVERLHVAMMEPSVLSKFDRAVTEPVLTGMIRSYSWDAGADRIEVVLAVEDHHRWEDVERQIMADARRQWDAIRDRWQSRPGWKVKGTRPELKRHIRWLYQRICPREDTDRPLGWQAIARQEQVQVTTVTSVVKALAAEMSLELPRVPPGRPRRLQG